MMEDMYGLHYNSDYSESQLPTIMTMPVPETMSIFSPSPTTTTNHHQSQSQYTPFSSYRDRIVPATMYGSENMFSSSSSAVSDDASNVISDCKRGFGLEDEISCTIRAKITAHPFYPNLVDAYIDCQKVGAPPEMVYVLDRIRRESDVSRGSFVSSCLGVDPELDEFMETYCDILMKYKSDLARPFNEATMFLNNIETQLNTLCNNNNNNNNNNGASGNSLQSEEAAGSSSEELSGAESNEMQESQWTNEERELKDSLLRKYSGYISTLKNEFSKKKKKGKLPREARQTLLDWWNIHYKWPYPTEVDKIALAESTGLDQKQINNWFINQRKRHWKPSENMQFSVMDSLYGPFCTNN